MACGLLHNLCLLHEHSAEEFLEPIEDNGEDYADDKDFPGVSANDKRQGLVGQFSGRIRKGPILAARAAALHAFAGKLRLNSGDQI